MLQSLPGGIHFTSFDLFWQLWYCLHGTVQEGALQPLLYGVSPCLELIPVDQAIPGSWLLKWKVERSKFIERSEEWLWCPESSVPELASMLAE